MTKKIKSIEDLGFGSRLGQSGDRLIQKNGSYNVIRKGNPESNMYQTLIAMSPIRFALFTFFTFVLINSVFAVLFLILGIEQLVGVPEGSLISDFLYAFFFSVQTFTTVGYGSISPLGISANFVASLCAMIGLIGFALVTGLFFARFSRPRSNIAFSQIGLITPYKNIKSFQFRIVNKRNHKIVNVSAQVILTWLEGKGEKVKRKFTNLTLERSRIVLFPLNWTVVHPIDEKSPMYGKTLEELREKRAEFLVMISGFDESYHQQINANSSYICKEIRTGVKFKPMYTSSNSKTTKLYLDDLDEVLELEKQVIGEERPKVKRGGLGKRENG